MRILYAITKAEMGGGQVHVLDLLKGFQSTHELHLATGEEEYLTREARAIGVECHILSDLIHETRPARDARAVSQMTALLRCLKPDLVHAHTTKAGLVARAAAWRCGIPSVFTAHSWAFSEGVSLAWKAMGVPTEWIASWLSSRVINVSEANRRLALKYGLPARRLVTIHNGIPDGPGIASPGAGGKTEVVMVARFARQKHHELLLEAFAGVPQPATLTLIGDGPSRASMQELAAKLGIAQRVTFAGERQDVTRLLAGAGVFALASRWEGFPLSILEAMRTGLPVVASDVGGSREAVEHGVSGYLVPRDDVAGFRAALTRLCTNAGLRSEFGSAGRGRYLQHFSLEQMLRKTHALYEQVWHERGIVPSRFNLVAKEVGRQ